MLHRPSPAGTIVVGQPAPLALRQIARAWAEPRAAEEAAWPPISTTSPGRPGSAPRSGTRRRACRTRPRRSLASRRLELWSGAAALLLPQSRYAALLVSLHGTLLVERFPPSSSEDVQRALADYLERERDFQARVLDSLRGDPRYGPHTTVEAVEQNRELIFTWDGLSLALVHGVTGEKSAAGHTLAARDGDPTRVTVAPWPFRDDAVTLVCEGRLVTETYADERELRRGLAKAPWITIETRLEPA